MRGYYWAGEQGVGLSKGADAKFDKSDGSVTVAGFNGG